MKSGRTRRLFAVQAFALTGVVTPCDGDDISPSPQVSTNLRDVRYCEVIPVTVRDETVISEVYNTLGLNFCPQAVNLAIGIAGSEDDSRRSQRGGLTSPPVFS